MSSNARSERQVDGSGAPEQRRGRGRSAAGLSLWPKEHGAYAEVTFPLLTGLLVAGFSVVGALFSAAVVAAFLVHEPLLVLLGVRGTRPREVLRVRAIARTCVLGTVIVLAGAASLFWGEPRFRYGTLAPAALGAVFIPFVIARREKTALGEMLVAMVFSSALVPVALAANLALDDALVAAAAWAATFIVGTFTVRHVLERARGERAAMRWLAPGTSAVVGAAAVAGVGWFGFGTLAALPAALVGIALWLRPVPAKRLRVLGWSLVASNVLTFLILLVALR